MKKSAAHPITQAINNQQKNCSRQQRLRALKWLQHQFPAAFDISLRIRPLKIGILEDIMQYSEIAAEQNISRSKLREAVMLHTRRLDYLVTLKLQEVRIDLRGNPIEQVSCEDAQQATQKIKILSEKSKGL